MQSLAQSEMRESVEQTGQYLIFIIILLDNPYFSQPLDSLADDEVVGGSISTIKKRCNGY